MTRGLLVGLALLALTPDAPGAQMTRGTDSIATHQVIVDQSAMVAPGDTAVACVVARMRSNRVALGTPALKLTLLPGKQIHAIPIPDARAACRKMFLERGMLTDVMFTVPVSWGILKEGVKALPQPRIG